jgi:hypothetical protein
LTVPCSTPSHDEILGKDIPEHVPPTDDILIKSSDDSSAEVRISTNGVANKPRRRQWSTSAHLPRPCSLVRALRKARRWRGQLRHAEQHNQIGADGSERFSEGLRKAEKRTKKPPDPLLKPNNATECSGWAVLHQKRCMHQAHGEPVCNSSAVAHRTWRNTSRNARLHGNGPIFNGNTDHAFTCTIWTDQYRRVLRSVSRWVARMQRRKHGKGGASPYRPWSATRISRPVTKTQHGPPGQEAASIRAPPKRTQRNGNANVILFDVFLHASHTETPSSLAREQVRSSPLRLLRSVRNAALAIRK